MKCNIDAAIFQELYTTGKKRPFTQKILLVNTYPCIYYDKKHFKDALFYEFYKKKQVIFLI